MAFYNGPLNKSLYTQQFELFTKCLLACPNAVSFSYGIQAEKKQLYGSIIDNHHELINLNISTLLTKTDFTDVSLSESDSQAYFKNYSKHLDIYSSDNDRAYQYNSEGKCPNFMQAEYSAIKDYTGSAYYAINNLMYKNGTNYLEENGKIIEKNELASDLIKIMFISSGLNKIMPDTEQTENTSFRGEHHTSEAEIQLRIDSTKSPDTFITTPAYTSTSSDKDVAKNFSGNVLIKYEGLPGKSVECISHFPHEKEYLLQPSKIQWLEHTEKDKNKFGEEVKVHEFKAKVVRPLIEGEYDPDFKQIETFKKLVDWAKEHNIDTGFITEYNKNIYLYDCLCDDSLDLEDAVACIVEKTLTFIFDEIIDCSSYLDNALEEYEPIDIYSNPMSVISFLEESSLLTL